MGILICPASRIPEVSAGLSAIPPIRSQYRFGHNTREMCPSPAVHWGYGTHGTHRAYSICIWYIPEQACGGSGNISVVELLRLATAQPKDCGLKLRSCCMKSEHSLGPRPRNAGRTGSGSAGCKKTEK